MSDLKKMIEETTDRLFADHVTPDVLKAGDEGVWQEDLWKKVEDTGLPRVLLDEDNGGANGDWQDAGVVIERCGYHGIPLPLGESIAANFLRAKSGQPIETDPTTIGIIRTDGDKQFAKRTPWARHVKSAMMALPSGGSITQINLEGLTIDHQSNMASEPRDDIELTTQSMESASSDNAMSEFNIMSIGAAVRAGQMAGALNRVLEMSVTYCNDRVQFGRPIGRFQAVQQQMAVLASEVAAASHAAQTAFEAMSQSGLDASADIAAAKIRTSEAAGKAADIAHAVHGAIGITQEHQLHYFTRRLRSWRVEFGSENYWAERLGQKVFSLGPDELWTSITENHLSIN